MTISGRPSRQISVKVRRTLCPRPDKTKLGNTEVKSFVQKVCNEQLTHWFEANPTDAKVVVNKAVSSGASPYRGTM